VKDVVVAKSPCNNSGGNSGFVLAHVESFGTPGSGNPIVFGGTVCVKSEYNIDQIDTRTKKSSSIFYLMCVCA
jgi:hypothetical protein